MKTTLIIPAYNEEPYIKPVLEVAKKAKKAGVIKEIIVVDDGSLDKTADVASRYADVLIRHVKNKGKGAAIYSGIQMAKGDIVLLVDADLINLKMEHLQILIEPIANKRAGMTIGVFKKTNLYARFGNLIPDINGQRAFNKKWAIKLHEMKNAGYGVDRLLTKKAKSDHLLIKVVPLFGLAQTFKERKKGFVEGFGRRIKMYREVFTMMKIGSENNKMKENSNVPGYANEVNKNRK